MTAPSRVRCVVGVLTTAAAMLLVSANTVSAETSATGDQDAILDVIDQFMHAVTNNDAALFDRFRVDGSVNFIDRPATGGTALLRRPATPGNVPPGNYRERYWDPTVHVPGRIVVAWTPYEFCRDGKTTHCGIDVFELVKEAGHVAHREHDVNRGAGRVPVATAQGSVGDTAQELSGCLRLSSWGQALWQRLRTRSVATH